MAAHAGAGTSPDVAPTGYPGPSGGAPYDGRTVRISALG